MSDGVRSSGTEVVKLEESVAGPGICGLCVRGNPIFKMHIQATMHN